MSGERGLDLADIQGNIVLPYGRVGFPFTRHLFFNVAKARAGRQFVEHVRQRVTSAQRWAGTDGGTDTQAPPRPPVCVNIGFSYTGLQALHLPTRTLSRLPEEFIDGMARRWSILGDIGPSCPQTAWDPVWQNEAQSREVGAHVHILVSLSAQAKPDGTPLDALAEFTAWLQSLATNSGGVTLLAGHRGPNPLWQDSAALMEELPDGRKVPLPREHFGFTDGIADPAFAGQYATADQAEDVIGGGKTVSGKPGWFPLATGEFILGHPNEAQELPETAPPWSFMRNGTFLAYRKLHQNVGSFDRYVASQAEIFRALGGADTAEAARETILAKMVGRWRSGIPLAAAPDFAAAEALARAWSDIPAIQRRGAARTPAETQRLSAYERMLVDFRYTGDEQGFSCPVASHIRRTNPRDSLDPSFGTIGATPDTTMSNRRRILRRGAPYGDSTVRENAGEHGVIFMAVCASLFDQFEFVQQQWVQYGASFGVGNDTDPMVGLRRLGAKFVIAADGSKGDMPFICTEMPQFVETRGGAYFFLPSLTALREIAEGSVDPT